jgi:hypothetical protein
MALNNPVLYNAALSGASAAFTSRWIQGASLQSFLTAKDVVIAFATEVDNQIGSLIPNPSQAQADLLQSICQAVLTNTFPQSTTSSDYTSIVTSILQAFEAMGIGLSPIGSVSNPPLAKQSGNSQPVTNDGVPVVIQALDLSTYPFAALWGYCVFKNASAPGLSGSFALSDNGGSPIGAVTVDIPAVGNTPTLVQFFITSDTSVPIKGTVSVTGGVGAQTAEAQVFIVGINVRPV